MCTKHSLLDSCLSIGSLTVDFESWNPLWGSCLRFSSQAPYTSLCPNLYYPFIWSSIHRSDTCQSDCVTVLSTFALIVMKFARFQFKESLLPSSTILSLFFKKAILWFQLYTANSPCEWRFIGSLQWYIYVCVSVTLTLLRYMYNAC